MHVASGSMASHRIREHSIASGYYLLRTTRRRAEGDRARDESGRARAESGRARAAAEEAFETVEEVYEMQQRE